MIRNKLVKGIYLIQRMNCNSDNEPQYYIGKAVDIFDRWNNHCNDTEQSIDQSICEIGCSNFVFRILEIVSKEDELNKCETEWIKKYREDYGDKALYNICQTANINTNRTNKAIKKIIKELFIKDIKRSIYAIAEAYCLDYNEVIAIRKKLLEKFELVYDKKKKIIVEKTTNTAPDNWYGHKMTKSLAELILKKIDEKKDNADIANECNISRTDLDKFRLECVDNYSYAASLENGI